MALKSPYSLLVIFAFLVCSSLFGVSTALGGRRGISVNVEPLAVVDAFVSLDPNDPKVVEVAKFAIDEYNKEKGAALTFNRVVQAASSHVAQGTTYALIIEANDATGSSDYETNVIVNKDGTRKLIAFKKRN